MHLKKIVSLKLFCFVLILKDCTSEISSEENNELYHKSRNVVKTGGPIKYEEAWKLGQPHILECVKFMREAPSSTEPQYYCKWPIGDYPRRYFWDTAEKLCIELREEYGQNFWRCRSPQNQYSILKKCTLLPDWCRDLIPIKKYEAASDYTKEQFRRHCEPLLV